MKKRYFAGILCLLMGLLSGCAASDPGQDALQEEQNNRTSVENMEESAAASSEEDMQTSLTGSSSEEDMQAGLTGSPAADTFTADTASGMENETVIMEEILEQCRAEFDRMVESVPTQDSQRPVFMEQYDTAISREEAETLCQRFLDSGLMEKEEMYLTGVAAGDYDGNGCTDMVVCLYSLEEEANGYSDGCLYLFMNEDEPCRIYEDFCCYGFGMIHNVFGADVDGDDRTEIIMLIQGTGNGGAGDSCKLIVKYMNPGIRRMELPSDLETDYDRGMNVAVKGDPEKGVYIAYCAELDEEIEFSAGRQVNDSSGANCRGYYALEMGEYQGEEALLGYEYLYAGGIVEGVGDAVFVIKWDEAGNPYVMDWYVEGTQFFN